MAVLVVTARWSGRTVFLIAHGWPLGVGWLGCTAILGPKGSAANIPARGVQRAFCALRRNATPMP